MLVAELVAFDKRARRMGCQEREGRHDTLVVEAPYLDLGGGQRQPPAVRPYGKYCRVPNAKKRCLRGPAIACGPIVGGSLCGAYRTHDRGSPSHLLENIKIATAVFSGSLGSASPKNRPSVQWGSTDRRSSRARRPETV